jgi:hypothetical protein
VYNDLDIIQQQLHVITNNGPKSVGGGGMLRKTRARESEKARREEREEREESPSLSSFSLGERSEEREETRSNFNFFLLPTNKFKVILACLPLQRVVKRQ